MLGKGSIYWRHVGILSPQDEVRRDYLINPELGVGKKKKTHFAVGGSKGFWL